MGKDRDEWGGGREDIMGEGVMGLKEAEGDVLSGYSEDGDRKERGYGKGTERRGKGRRRTAGRGYMGCCLCVT